MIMRMKYSQAIQQLINWGAVGPRRDEFILDAYDSDVPKSEIAKLTGVSWQTVDRVIRAAGRPSDDERED